MTEGPWVECDWCGAVAPVASIGRTECFDSQSGQHEWSPLPVHPLRGTA